MNFDQAREAMVDCQVRPSDVTRYPIIEAMLSIPREEFVPAASREVAYADMQIPLSAGRAMLDPRTFAKMLDAAAIQSDDLVLDIGCGLGYSTALIARMAEAAIGVEEVPELATEAARLIADADTLNAVVEEAPLAAGAEAHGPYDVIMIGGTINMLPAALEAQLKEGGRIVTLWSDDATGYCRVGIKGPSGIAWRRAFDATAPVLPGFAAEKSFVF